MAGGNEIVNVSVALMLLLCHTESRNVNDGQRAILDKHSFQTGRSPHLLSAEPGNVPVSVPVFLKGGHHRQSQHG